MQEDILDDPGYRNLKPIEQAIWIDILATFNRQRAHEQANAVLFPWRSALSILRSSNKAKARQRATNIGCRVGAAWGQVPEGLLCLVPNYAKLQGLTPSGLPPRSDATPSTTPTPTPTPTSEPSVHTETPPEPSGPVGDDSSDQPKPRARKTLEEYPDEARAVARELFAVRRALDPNAKTPSTAAALKWVVEADRMLRLDPPDRQERWREVVGWLGTHEPPAGSRCEFWQGVIRSAPGLRKHWERIRDDLDTEARNGPNQRGTHKPGPLEQAHDTLQQAVRDGWEPRSFYEDFSADPNALGLPATAGRSGSAGRARD